MTREIITREEHNRREALIEMSRKPGHIVIQQHKDIILVYREHSYTPFVVWRLDDLGNTFAGNYCTSLTEACESFKRRAGVDA